MFGCKPLFNFRVVGHLISELPTYLKYLGCVLGVNLVVHQFTGSRLIRHPDYFHTSN